MGAIFAAHEAGNEAATLDAVSTDFVRLLPCARRTATARAFPGGLFASIGRVEKGVFVARIKPRNGELRGERRGRRRALLYVPVAVHLGRRVPLVGRSDGEHDRELQVRIFRDDFFSGFCPLIRVLMLTSNVAPSWPLYLLSGAPCGSSGARGLARHRLGRLEPCWA